MKRKGAKVHGPGVRLSELYCGNDWTENAQVSPNKADWSCERCLAKNLRAEMALIRASINTTGRRLHGK